MTRLLIRRLLFTIPTLFGVLTATFFVTHVLPGNPSYLLAGAGASKQEVAVVAHRYGLDLSLPTQYWNYISGVVTRFDLGRSLFSGNTVVWDLWRRFPSTLELVTSALFIALLIGIPVGAYAARHRGGVADRITRVASFVLLATPEFWFALLALFFLYFKLRIAPAPIGQLGLTDPEPTRITGAALWDSILTANWPALKASLAHAAIPFLTFGLVLSAPIMRLTRSAVLEVLHADYIRFARASGLGGRVLWRYAVRAAMPPVLTFSAVIFTQLLGGVVLIETIFSWGGAAEYAAQAVQQNDYSAVQGFVLIVGIISVVTFLLVDLLYVAIDPRVRLVRPEAAGSWRARGASLRGAAGAFRIQMVLPAGLLHRAGTIRDWSGRLISLTRQNAARARRRRGRMSIARLRHSAVLWRAGVRRSINPLLVGGLAILLLLLVASFVVPAISPFGPDQLNLEGALKAPSGTHPFGTDSSGFDLFVRVFYAARLDLGIALLGVVIGLVIGGLVGLFVGFSDGLISEFIMRIIDVVQAFPPLILAIALVALTGNKLINLAYVIGFLNIPVFLRLIRGQVLVIREQRYIDVARALGNPRWRIMLRHVLPNAAGPAIVQFGLSAGYAVLIIAGIAFLGIGIHPPTAEWGSLILDGSQYVTSGQWWLFLFPGVALAIAVAGFNMVAEGVERAREVARA